MKERWHRSDEDKYNYKRFRKGHEQVEAWWLDPHPYAHPNSRHWHNEDSYYKKYWSHPNWQNTKDPYPYPPPKGGP